MPTSSSSASWVRLASAGEGSSSSRIEVHDEGLSVLSEAGERVGLASFVSGWASRRESLGALGVKVLGSSSAELPPNSTTGSSLWVRVEPVSKNKEGTVLLAECAGLLNSEASRKLASLTLLASSVLLYASPFGGGRELGAVERWGALESLMSLVSFAAPGQKPSSSSSSRSNDGPDVEREGVFGAMPALVWALDEVKGPPGKAVEGLLATESGFDDDASRRNNARLLVKSVFRTREATRLEPAAAVGRAVDLAHPKLALGRVCSGAMLATMLRTWCDALGVGAKASVVVAARAALDGLYARSLEAALSAHAAALAGRRVDEAKAPDYVDDALAEASAVAEKTLAEATRAAAPSPRGSGPAPRPPVEELRAAIRDKAAEVAAANAAKAATVCDAALATSHAALLETADKAAGFRRGVSDDDSDDSDDDAAPTSRRGELWIQAYKGRLGALLADYASGVECADAARGAAGAFLSRELGKAAIDRCSRALATLESERRGVVEAMRAKRAKTAELEAELADIGEETHRAMSEHNKALMGRMADSETLKMEREADLAAVDMEVDSALRNAERVDARLRVKLEGAVSRASARLDDAKMLRRRHDDVAALLTDEVRKARDALVDARLDALRVRCVTLGHEKANLAEHMELLEEHLERLKADLDHKHAEVAEVEHQWSQTKAKLPALKAKHTDAEHRRSLLADLSKRLKAKCKDQGKGSLPRQLLHQLDPMERQALDDL